MQRSVPLLVLPLLALAFAGCADGGGAAVDGADDPVDRLDLVATDTTGVLRGVVVDEAIRPIANATLEVTGTAQRTATTGPDGVFGFDQLPPGTYFVKATRLGFLPTQQSAEVVAGVADPPAVKLLLQRDAGFQAFVEVQQYEGFIECTTSILVLCGIPNVLTGQNITNDRFAWDQSFSDNATHLQAEMVWESTQAASPELYFEMEVLHDDCERAEGSEVGSFLNSTRGPSPIYATVNQSEVRDWDLGQVCPIYMSLFSGGVPGAPCGDADPTGTAPGWCAGATLQQRFTMYFHGFYNFMPNPGWRFTVDGQPVPPS